MALSLVGLFRLEEKGSLGRLDVAHRDVVLYADPLVDAPDFFFQLSICNICWTTGIGKTVVTSAPT